MASKRQNNTPSDPRGAVIDAALKLASKRDWENVTLADIAKAAGISLAALSQMFECREDILAAYARRVDTDVLDSFDGSGEGPAGRDQLFDIMMERFERLNNDRAALLSILASAKTDPKQWVIALPQTAKSMAWMLEASGMDTLGWKGAARVAGLSAVYLWTMRAWLQDDSPDLGKTMATLDKALGRAESIANTVNL